MSYQDNFYKKFEADAFFKRNINSLPVKDLRKNKIKIYNILNKQINLSKKKVLEIGCFIGDFLHFLKKKHKCKVYGIEPSKLACKYAKKRFKINLENKTFSKSSYFLNNKKNLSSFDLIICNDVLSWIDRNLILSTIGSIDWLLKENGYIFLRDFSPNNSIMVKNHHWNKKKIFNFKQKNGHKTYFLNSGKYITIKNYLFISDSLQKKKSRNIQTKIWNDILLKKIKNYTFLETAL